MRIARITLFTALLGGVFSACECDNLDCLSNNYDGHFRIIKASDGTDLVFGVGRIYDKRKIMFYTLKGIDTIFFNYQPIKLSYEYDSILQVNFYPQAEDAFIQLGNGDIDTLKISYKTYNTKCCGTITEITNFRVNNSIDLPGDVGTQEIRK